MLKSISYNHQYYFKNKQMKLKLIITCFLCSLFYGFAQNSGTIKGKIIDKNTKQPLPYVNIVIKDNDKIITGGVTKDDGSFAINQLSVQKYTVCSSPEERGLWALERAGDVLSELDELPFVGVVLVELLVVVFGLLVAGERRRGGWFGRVGDRAFPVVGAQVLVGAPQGRRDGHLGFGPGLHAV